MGKCRLDYSSDLLRELLKIPIQYDIEEIKFKDYNTIEILVSGMDIKEVDKGKEYPQGNIICTHVNRLEVY